MQGMDRHEEGRAGGCGGCGCGGHAPAVDAGRRASLRAMAGATMVAGAAGVMRPADVLAAEGDKPREGDLLVNATGDGTPLKVDDIAPGEKQRIAFPFDAQGGRRRDGSRLNRVLLIRLEPGKMDDETRKRSADGVLAYSAICTHQGCDVSAWRAEEQALLCFCHLSRFLPLKHGVVSAGPAQRPLPWLPLRSEGGRIVVAGGFNTNPGSAT